MSKAPVQTQGGLESHPPLPVRPLHNFIYCPRWLRLSETTHAQPTSFDDALESANGDGFVAVNGYDHLPAIGMTTFLVEPFFRKTRTTSFADAGGARFVRGEALTYHGFVTR